MAQGATFNVVPETDVTWALCSAEINQFLPDMQPLNAEVISGLPAELLGASLSTFLQQTSAYQPPQSGVSIQQGIASPQFQVCIYINPPSSFPFKL